MRILSSLRTAFCVVGIVAVVLLAAFVAFAAYSYPVMTDTAPAGEPGTVRYETREFWLSLSDWINGRDEEWTAQLPTVLGGGGSR